MLTNPCLTPCASSSSADLHDCSVTSTAALSVFVNLERSLCTCKARALTEEDAVTEEDEVDTASSHGDGAAYNGVSAGDGDGDEDEGSGVSGGVKRGREK